MSKQKGLLRAVISLLVFCSWSAGDNASSHTDQANVLRLDLGQNTKLELVLLQPGQYLMGDPDGKEGSFLPTQRQAEIKLPFYIALFETTRGQFKRFVEHTGYKTLAEKTGHAYVWKTPYQCQISKGVYWQNPGFLQDDEHPVVLVSWSDACAFCTWLARKTGKTVRLPTETEWEYACRAGTTTPFNTGEKITPQEARCNAFESVPNNVVAANLGTTKVGSFKPNVWGIHDMHGNVAEWCLDEAKHQGFSLRMAEPDKFGSDSPHVVRGGSWRCPTDICRSALRQVRPGPIEPCLAYDSVGFRIVVEVDSPSTPETSSKENGQNTGDRQPHHVTEVDFSERYRWRHRPTGVIALEGPGARFNIAFDPSEQGINYAGLTFKNRCELRIDKDDLTLLVDRADIRAKDADGQIWVSRKVALAQKEVFAFFPDKGTAPVAHARKPPSPLTDATTHVPGKEAKTKEPDKRVIALGKDKADQLGYNPIYVFMNDRGTISLAGGSKFTIKNDRWALEKGDMLINCGQEPVKADDLVLMKGEYALVNEDGLKKGERNLISHDIEKDVDESKEKIVWSLPMDDSDKGEATLETALVRAELLSLIGKGEDAYSLFEKALRRAKDPEMKARAMAGMGGSLMTEGRNQEAEAMLDNAWKLAETGDTKARILVCQFNLSFAKRDFAEAQSRIDVAAGLAESPEIRAVVLMSRAAALVAQGRVRDGKKQFVRAGEHIEAAIRATKSPEKKAILKGVLAVILLSQSRFDEALARLAEAEELTADRQRKCHFILLEAGICLTANRLQDARTKCERLFQVAPSKDYKSEALMGFGEIAEKKGQPQMALSKYEEALKASESPGTRSKALFKVATSRLECGQIEAAREAFEEVIGLTKSPHRKARSMANIGLIFLRQNNPKEARSILEQALKLATRPSIRTQIQKLLDEAIRLAGE